MLRDASIRQQLTAMTALSAITGLLLAAAALIVYAWNNARAGFARDLHAVAHIVSDTSTAALVFHDRKAAIETLAALRAKPEIQLACLYANDAPGEAFGDYSMSGTLRCPPRPEPPGLYRSAETQTLVREVVLRGEPAGTLRLTQTLQPLRTALRNQVAITLGILALAYAVSLLVASRMQGRITGPLLALAGTARRVSETRNYGLRASGGGRNEVGRLVEDFNGMLGQVASQELAIRRARDALEAEVAEKSRANAELQNTLARLREAQAQLVQSEKLASLGALVAGVAHEINTPVGVGVTAASTLQARAAQLVQRHRAGALTAEDIERFVAIAGESSRIILTNLERAANLIRSFKQVAVDQSSGERRRFQIKRYLEEVLVSLGPGLRKGEHRVTLDCPEALEADSYPGALAQVITNFIGNSLVHAFAPGQRGRIDIRVHEAGDGMIELLYSDDGCGMPPEHLARIFDPFFTTKRGAGGSGLGMHIVYNLVTQVLEGRIAVDSTPGDGVRIKVSFRKEPLGKP